MAFRVFVSHSTADPEILLGLSDFVKEQGAEPLIAELIVSPGTWLEDKVRNMISRCDLVIAVLTRNGTRSQWVNWEIGAAVAMNKPIVPLLEEGVVEPSPLRGREYLRFSLEKIESTFDSISKFMQRRMGVKSRKLGGLAILIGGIAAVIIGLVLLLYDDRGDKTTLNTTNPP